MVNGILNDTLMTKFYPAIASMDEVCLTFEAKLEQRNRLGQRIIPSGFFVSKSFLRELPEVLRLIGILCLPSHASTPEGRFFCHTKNTPQERATTAFSTAVVICPSRSSESLMGTGYTSNRFMIAADFGNTWAS